MCIKAGVYVGGGAVEKFVWPGWCVCVCAVTMIYVSYVIAVLGFGVAHGSYFRAEKISHKYP